ncbi:MAG: glycosyl transferase [Bacillus thermozeamaize]|uniref:Glycosyl transferase n=1 Tax=Bacillus thermozeamaize TaxID=230954 RepID=A0A1Y3PIQ8_9BACI|nr:MAG: glycosyl transferase [Bacillus thermozeamaize]
MNLPVHPTLSPHPTPQKTFYVPVIVKFFIGHGFALLWMFFSVYISLPWLYDLADVVTFPIALLIIGGIAYVPGYLNAFLVISLILDQQPPFKTEWPNVPITILIACRNEEKKIANTLRYIQKQDYPGDIQIIIIDNGSTDRTSEEAKKAAESLGLSLRIIREENPGKFNALNAGLLEVKTRYLITLDADTLLHRSAVRYLVSRMLSAPVDVCAVAGAVLVRNSRENWLAKIQEWDYFLGIASIKRLQGLYQGTLVAQGAYSIYMTECIKKVGGWPNAIGEDIVLTWSFLKNGWKVYFEPLAVAFTDVPVTFSHFIKQRSRWARGMIEALKETKPWQQPLLFAKYLTGVNLVIPYIDFTYTFFWIPGLILAFFGIYWIVGPMTILVLPLTLLSYYILYIYQKSVFQKLDLRIRKNRLGFWLFVLCYQMILAPVSVWGYIQEVLHLERVWK